MPFAYALASRRVFIYSVFINDILWKVLLPLVSFSPWDKASDFATNSLVNLDVLCDLFSDVSSEELGR